MQYTESFIAAELKISIRETLIFFSFLLSKAVLMTTYNLCFGTNIRKIGIPLDTPVLLYKSGV